MNGDAYSREGRHGSSRDHKSRGDRDDRERRERGDRGERGDRERRRRSRSPGHRSRRDYEYDTYSSSRDYREREREDRYRDRREDRGWERNPRREPRREEEERPPRRERDLFDDRDRGRGRRGADRENLPGGGGGGGGGAAGGRGGAGREQRNRSASPPPKKREPTPDLTDIVSVLDRKRRLTQWDIKPPGYENVTAEQAKLSGMFPLPGAPRQQPMDPSRLQAFINPQGGVASNSSLKPTSARQAKRLFVYNLPASANDNSVAEFFNLQLNGLNVVSGVDPCISAQISKDHEYALVEFKQPEDATMALALDGITMEDSDGMNGASNGDRLGISIRRPKDYIAPSATDDSEYPEGVLSDVVKDSANKISVSHIPAYLTDEQVTELLTSFGELKAFVLVKDTGTEQSSGVAFCEYNDPSTTDIAVEGLNGMELGEQHLKVQRASIGATQVSGLEMGVNAMSMLAGTTSTELEQGRVLQLLNMVTAEELMDGDEYDEICEDVKEECEKYGKVLDMKIPRPVAGRQTAGVGKIFVKFEAPDSAKKALSALAGRKFADRTVVVTYFGEEYFDVNAW